MGLKAAWELTLWIFKNFDLVLIILGIADLVWLHAYESWEYTVLFGVGIVIRALRIFLKIHKRS